MGLHLDDTVYLSMKRLRQKGLTYKAIAERHHTFPKMVKFILSQPPPSTVTPEPKESE